MLRLLHLQQAQLGPGERNATACCRLQAVSLRKHHDGPPNTAPDDAAGEDHYRWGP